ncbi:restriction system-associated AAA family ATPase [Kushneria sp. Sum13]|uniref:restriction system-associated AAA family ATPase n=1 Tax=Kushneria sp. Sum13 TaxID=3459196 RepID=UPI0040465604
MKITWLHVIDADTCGGLLNGVVINFRDAWEVNDSFSPICLIGPNGAGKSQALQIIAEIFQAAFAQFLPDEEQGKPNNQIQFELEYFIFNNNKESERVKIWRKKGKSKRLSNIVLEVYSDNRWVEPQDYIEAKKLLPSKIIGYTSGQNETISIPFFVSRSGYAKQVSTNALDKEKIALPIPDSRMLLVDYSTNLEVLMANLILNPKNVREYLVNELGLKKLRSFRCVIQLKYGSSANSKVQLTDELNNYISYLKRCATCFEYDEKNSSYVFDFFVQEATHESFSSYWEEGALELYSCFHKLAMLNDLIIPKQDREAFLKGVEKRRFSTRLPEPMEKQKVFRFERVEFISKKGDKHVDYVSLSDGEHQLTQLLGTLCMASFPNVLFLLDEPESHFNPRWRVEFVSKILNLPTTSVQICSNEGKRHFNSLSSKQDCLLTTHSPFVPSDMDSENVIIFKRNFIDGKVSTRKPRIQTYGSTFDTILEECFEISPPISDIPKREIEKLLNSDNIEEIKKAVNGLGDSVERMYLIERVRMLKAKES